MNPAIIPYIQSSILDIYRGTKEGLGRLPSNDLHELKHRAEEQLHHADFSMRTAAEITRAACYFILQERSQKP